MNIPIFPFEEATELKPNNPFPNYISEDPNVLYHGTSSLYEQSIENTGLCVNTSTFTKEEIEEVCTLFDCVKWPNKRFWSESNLRNYTLNHDFKNPDLKPLYLAECSERASLYASIEFAGGEIARAVRNTFKDLEKLINDPQELVKEKEAIERDTLYTGRTVLDYDLSLDILQLKLKELKSYKEKAAISLESFQYGVIYAVKFSTDDLSFIEHSIRSGMGVKFFKSISKNKIIGKTKVPLNYEHNFNHFVDYDELPSMNGILSHVKTDCREY